MTTFSVQSGSNGNCIYYESGGVKLLFDAGISYKSLKERLTANGIDPLDIDALIVSHDHSDHSKSIGIFQRKIKMPVFISRKTFDKIERYLGKIMIDKFDYFIPDDVIKIKHINIYTIKTPHDGIEPSIFIVDDGRSRVGIFTDLGYVFDGLMELIHSLDAVYLESNYELSMLKRNPNYPISLKRRIVGDGGHIDNEQSARLIKEYTEDRLKYLLLSHLSEENNTPGLALGIHNNIYEGNNNFELLVAPRNNTSKIITIS